MHTCICNLLLCIDRVFLALCEEPGKIRRSDPLLAARPSPAKNIGERLCIKCTLIRRFPLYCVTFSKVCLPNHKEHHMCDSRLPTTKKSTTSNTFNSVNQEHKFLLFLKADIGPKIDQVVRTAMMYALIYLLTS